MLKEKVACLIFEVKRNHQQHYFVLFKKRAGNAEQ
jgi:hypothetical protein